MQKPKRYTYLLLSLILSLLMVTGKTTAQISSQKLKAKVESALNRNYMNEFYVNADENGKVTIKGEVNTLYDRLNIFDIVSGVKGVKEIDDQIIVNIPMLPDDIIKANIERAQENNSVIIEPDKINVKVTSGLVILTGSVSYHKEKLMAETISSWQDGVKSIENDINVLPPKQARSDDNIKSILNEILINKFPLVKNKIKITVNNGDVFVDGEVQSLWEKINLRKDFLQVLGVKNVTENLNVNYTE
jgi:osmotically-inducible protein OsmY